jgi:8-oxo-dGTP pyrophosphatase MutT (NUDIX family)
MNKIAPSEEQVAIVDGKNRVIGCAGRSVMRRFNLIHRATYILLLNARGELFVQKRTAGKDVYPGYYEVAVGGVVQAGEEYDVSAQRELAEEVGLDGAVLTPLFDFYWQDEGNRVWGRAYICAAEGPLTLQPEEVEWGRFMDIDEILRLRRTEPFTPDGLYLLDRYLTDQVSG